MGKTTWTDLDRDGPELANNNAILHRELIPGERIVWHDRPRRYRAVWQSLLWCLPFGLAFGGGPLTLVTLADGGPNGFPPMAVIPFVVIGGFIILYPVWFGWRTVQTRYAITNRRVIVVIGKMSGRTETRSWVGNAIRSVLRTEYADGSGDLVFEEAIGPEEDGRVQVMERGFFGVEDVHQVEAILRVTLLDHRVGP